MTAAAVAATATATTMAVVGRLSREGWKRGIAERKNVKGRGRPRAGEMQKKKYIERMREKQRTLGI